jgi:hypothetical protein
MTLDQKSIDNLIGEIVGEIEAIKDQYTDIFVKSQEIDYRKVKYIEDKYPLKGRIDCRPLKVLY